MKFCYYCGKETCNCTSGHPAYVFYEDTPKVESVGWCCPKCYKVWSPTVEQCKPCNGVYDKD